MSLEPKIIDNKRSVQEYIYPESRDQISVEDFISNDKFIGLKNFTEKLLLEQQFEGITNHRRLFNALNLRDRRANNDGGDQYNENASYPIAGGATIYIPSDRIDVDYKLISNVSITKTKVKKYFPESFRLISNNPGFVPAHKRDGEQLQTIAPQLTVWLWSRERYLNNSNSGFINITDDVISCSVDSSIDGGGSFNLVLQPIPTTYESGSGWVRDDSQTQVVNINKPRENKGRLVRTGREFERTDLYYDRIISQNDMIFISFEKLFVESDRVNKISDQWYDMIGLIDYNTISTAGEQNDVTISIRGRDLSKALIDDNSYFNPFSIGHANSLYGGSISANGRYLQGEFKTISAFLPKTVQQAVEFVLQRITSIGYTPSDIFNDFSNLTTRSQFNETDQGVVGVWQLIKLFVDENIEQLILTDDSISNPNGSIMDILNKIAELPFIEFLTDTYGDKFHLVFRMPPHTQEALLEIVDDLGEKEDAVVDDTINPMEAYERIKEDEYKGNLKEASITNETSFPRVISIGELDVLSDNLRMSNECYSWYKINNRGIYGGEDVSLGAVPSIYFDEYAQVFGNKRLEITSNYSDHKFFESTRTDKDLNLFAEQSSQLLAYLVETNIMLPFTREGSITINGDRRIRKGTWIYYIPTNEMYYVNSVSNSISISDSSIDRTTTIEVNRGMVFDYIGTDSTPIKVQNDDGSQIPISYFSIVNIDKLKDGIYDTVSKGSANDKFDHKSDMFLNKEIFEFFLNKRQFVNEEA